MINLDDFVEEVRTPLNDYAGPPQIIRANQKIPTNQLKDGRVVYNLINLSQGRSRHANIEIKEVVSSTSVGFDEDVMIKHFLYPEATISYTGFGEASFESIALIREWFYTHGLGDYWLEDNDISAVIREVTAIDDRTVYLESDYEKRYGFDVIIEFEDIVEVRHDTIESVEVRGEIKTVDFDGEIEGTIEKTIDL